MCSSRASLAASPKSEARTQGLLEIEPGTRIIAGRPSIANQDVNNLHHAHRRVVQAPALLVGLSYEDLTALIASCRKVLSAPTFDLAALGYPVDLSTAQLQFGRACAEQATRPEHQRAFGSVAVQPRRAA